MPPAPRDVFVSYNRADRAWAEWIAWALEEAGYSVVIQAWDFRPGGNFVLSMQEATAARHTLPVLSPSYLAAEYTQPEWAAAFARDPQGKDRALIPVRVEDCNPDGLLGQVIYADLVGLGEESARRTLLDAFRDRGKPPEEPPFPGGMRGIHELLERPKPDFPGPPIAVSVAKLPATGKTFVAREAELSRLDAAWEHGTNVLGFIATGGAGKSALVNAWLGRMQEDGWRGAERVLGWSFYSQGTDAVGASSEAFIEYALDWLGYRGAPITSPWRRGEVLATFLRDKRTLLVLDGLEPLQHPPGPQKGRIKDPAVQSLLRELAASNPGLCVVTTRLEVTDLAGRAGTESVDLEKLPPEAGSQLLRALGVEGAEKELQEASRERGGHGLALTLLGTYLRDVRESDVRRRNEVKVLDETAGIEGSDHARHVMEAYETWLGSTPGGRLALQLLHLLGLFDHPAEPAALAALRAEPEIPGLTDGIGAGDEATWKTALARLRQARLVAEPEQDSTAPGRRPLDGAPLDTHPLVREYFGERLRQNAPEAWRAANECLYDHYRTAAPEHPDTLDEMLPLYAAVVHGCRAGKEQEACNEVYQRRILRGNEHYSWKQLGTFGSEVTAFAAFFERPWDRPSSRLTEADRRWLLHEAGFCLRALGRLPEAEQPMRAGLEAAIAEESWADAAIGASNLSELTLTLGDMAGAVATAEESVELADRSGDAFMRLANRATLADALHQAGRWEESEALFRESEAMQAEREPRYPRLSSLGSYRFCDLLLSRTEPADGSGLEGAEERYWEACQEVRERAAYAIEIAERNHWLLDIALDHLNLGRAHLGLALTAVTQPPDFRPAAEHLDWAVDGLREAATEHQLPRGLLARAALRRIAGDQDGAASDLREAQETAERGSMRLFEADAHLEHTRLHLATGDPAAARRHLDRARDLVRECGYGRREREVTWLEGRLAALEGPEGGGPEGAHLRRHAPPHQLTPGYEGGEEDL